MCSLKRRVDSLEKKLNLEPKKTITIVGDVNSDWEKLKEEYIQKNGINPEDIGLTVCIIDRFGPIPADRAHLARHGSVKIST